MASTITTLKLGKMDNFIHFITDNASKQTFVVDPAWDFQAIQRHLSDNAFVLTGVLLTHSHGDHISALSEVVDSYQVPTYVSENEYQLGRVKVPPTFVKDQDSIALGESRVSVLATPGHTSGGVCYHVDNHLITGDTLFIYGCGICIFEESDVEQLWDSIQRLKTLPDDTLIYSGHDYATIKTDTLGNQKKTNPYLLIEDKPFFIDFRMQLQSQYRSIPFSRRRLPSTFNGFTPACYPRLFLNPSIGHLWLRCPRPVAAIAH